MQEILGQGGAVHVLQSALRAERLHHAYIFHGPAGVGKFTTAIAFARVLLCHDVQLDLAQQVTACTSCESCRLLGDIETPAHPDLHVLRKELAAVSQFSHLRKRKQHNIPVDLLREHMIGGNIGTGPAKKYVEPVVGNKPLLGYNKVFIIDEAELLEQVGQNALLKTLEEPPAQTYIILVTTNEDKLLPTVRSRCQRVAFVPLADDIVSRWLDGQEVQLDEAQRLWLVGFACGSLGRVQLAVQYDLSSWARDVLEPIDAMVDGQYPVQLGGCMAEHIENFAKRWVDEHPNASKSAANRQAAALMWSLVACHAQQKIAQLAPDCDGHDLQSAEAVLQPWLAAIDSLHRTEKELAGNVLLNLATDHLVSLLYRALSSQQMLV